MQYRVPQFIDIEDKIFGPFTWKQFIYLAGGAGLVYLSWHFLPFFFALICIVPVAGFSLALAFYKVNERPFIELVESWFLYTFGTKLYIWKKEPKKQDAKAVTDDILKAKQQVIVPKLSESKLQDVAWSLEVLDNAKKG